KRPLPPSIGGRMLSALTTGPRQSAGLSRSIWRRREGRMTKELDLSPDLLRFSKHAGFVRVAVQRIFEDMCAWEHVKKRPTENYADGKSVVEGKSLGEGGQLTVITGRGYRRGGWNRRECCGEGSGEG